MRRPVVVESDVLSRRHRRLSRRRLTRARLLAAGQPEWGLHLRRVLRWPPTAPCCPGRVDAQRAARAAKRHAAGLQVPRRRTASCPGRPPHAASRRRLEADPRERSRIGRRAAVSTASAGAEARPHDSISADVCRSPERRTGCPAARARATHAADCGSTIRSRLGSCMKSRSPSAIAAARPPTPACTKTWPGRSSTSSRN